MAAILAKKLGMTQRFLDDGRVERVTVSENGQVEGGIFALPKLRKRRES